MASSVHKKSASQMRTIGRLEALSEPACRRVVRISFSRSWRDKISTSKIDSPFTNLFEQGGGGAVTFAGGTGGAWTKSSKMAGGSGLPLTQMGAAGRSPSPGVSRPGTASPSRSRSGSPVTKHRSSSSMLKDGPNNASSLKMLRMKKQQDA